MSRLTVARPRLIHWRRERKDGSVDFHFEAAGEKMRGNALGFDVDGLQAIFEQHVGRPLPAANTSVKEAVEGDRNDEGRPASRPSLSRPTLGSAIRSEEGSAP